MVKLLFYHTSESKPAVYCQILHVVETEKKYFKCNGKTFILPQKREYDLLSDLECSRNCWENPQARMLQNQYTTKDVAVFDFICSNKKQHSINSSVKLLYCHTSENTVLARSWI